MIDWSQEISPSRKRDKERRGDPSTSAGRSHIVHLKELGERIVARRAEARTGAVNVWRQKLYRWGGSLGISIEIFSLHAGLVLEQWGSGKGARNIEVKDQSICSRSASARPALITGTMGASRINLKKLFMIALLILKVKRRLFGSHITPSKLPKEMSNSLESQINKRCLNHQCLW